jgi:predicted ATPase
MPYSYSDQERANLKWFANDCTRQSLKAISINRGQLRGLSKFRIEFTYPISAIAGKNGSGKSSVLALAACAFHNKSAGWKLPDRKFPYYTFSDFFIQAAEDVPLDGVSIFYEIAHDKWKPNERLPDGIGLGLQVRKKNKGGKWNDYDKRVPRCVAFLGIERVVPPAERTVYKSYRYSFSSSAKSGREGRVRESVSRVLGVAYEDFEIKSHGKYRLPLVKRSSAARYSGFNMGAGEKALFELFATIYAAPDGTLFLVDELELGLHESAQRRLVGELNEVCQTRKIQVICTTHSPIVLAALPPEGRFLIQSGDTTQVLAGVSPEFAAGRMGDINSGELKIFVEDEIAATLVEAALEHTTSQRVRIVPIGPHSAVVHQMAAHFLEDHNCKDCVAFLDGDQSPLVEAHRKQFLSWLGKGPTADALKWIEQRLSFLPGNTAPELWVLKELATLSDHELLDCFHISDLSRVRNAINTAILTNPHGQIHTLASSLSLNERYTWRDCCTSLRRYKQKLFEPIIKSIQTLLQ